MAVSIRVKYFATTKETKINLSDPLDSLRSQVERLFGIPAPCQSLLLDDRNISTSSKSIGELGVREGSTIVVKRMHRFSGASKGNLDIASIMKNPMVKGMISNPETIKTIQDMFPELKEEMMQNKTLNMMMSNGGFEEELEKMTLDSDYMSAQLRNADVTMARLENIPGGINMMSGMIKDVEEPFKSIDIGANIVSGERIEKKMTASIPGTSRANALVDYRKQLSELRRRGYENTAENVEVLQRVNGDLKRAIETLERRSGSKPGH